MWACVRCGNTQPRSRLQASMDPGYRIGMCANCGRSVWRRVQSERVAAKQATRAAALKAR